MFVSFEGIDGSGKSTQIALLVERLRRSGETAEVFREPGGAPLAERIRELLLDTRYDIHPFAELLLFSAARAQLVATRIRPALEKGGVVVCDRFFDSTTAYQGGGRELEELTWLNDFHHRVTGGLVPHRTYLLEIDPEAALARRQGRFGQAADRMESGDLTFYERVAAAYRELARREPRRILALDATKPVDELHDLIWADVERLRENLAGTRGYTDGSSKRDEG